MIELVPGPQGLLEKDICKICDVPGYSSDNPRCDCSEAHHVDCCPWLAELHEQALEEEKKWLARKN